MDLSAITREAVLEAIGECDRLGRGRFLEEYGFDPARRYSLHYNGVFYDSKAVVGVAYRSVAGRPLSAREFSGGRQTVGRLLTRLGFEVIHDEPLPPLQRLIAQLQALRVDSTADGPARHQPITLLWALGRAAHRKPRLVPWNAAHSELRGLLREYGQPRSRPRPEFPIIALAHTELWEMHGHTGDIPAAHGEPLGWMEEHDPHSGLSPWVYELTVSSEEARGEAVAEIGRRFFGGTVPRALLHEVGLRPVRANRLTRQDVGDREVYQRLCRSVEDAESRGDHDRTSRTTSERPVRSASAVEAVLLRSLGRCENPVCAGQPDDVTDRGKPLLEVDHIEDRASWGRDHPSQMIALCPNCHAIKTRGRTRDQLRELLLAEARSRHTAWESPARS
ncbi:HNH endonuclease signature motif containing protein [Actinomadura roseirufa]|uniref:HNH endonuclease signature motif containing protein n=1 Tax=Actinomadura roseirufa TaxID=2094049 RepID=UPI001041B9B5|nr:HNH endonuclease signature motif containing protein [Actinomadura roseirufa]